MLINVLTDEPTHFYIKTKQNIYGVRVNKNEKDKNNIINKILEENTQTIKNWLKKWEV